MQRAIHRIAAQVQYEIHHFPLGENRTALVRAGIGQRRHCRDEISLLKECALPQSDGGGWQVHGRSFESK